MHIDPSQQSARRARFVSTGTLPRTEVVLSLLEEAHELYRSVDDGSVADYIPALVEVPADLFALAVVGVNGSVSSAGDVGVEFSIQSISKPFVFALVCEAIGFERARELVGVNSTGLAFDSVMAVELNPERTANPMVNAGAIATTSLVPGETAEQKWEFVRAGLSRFAGRELQLDSEALGNQRNQGIARLLQSYDRMYFDPLQATDVYTRQCSPLVTTIDLAVMGATLADGGVIRSAANELSIPKCAAGCSQCLLLRASTSAPATGSTTSGYARRAASAAEL